MSKIWSKADKTVSGWPCIELTEVGPGGVLYSSEFLPGRHGILYRFGHSPNPEGYDCLLTSRAASKRIIKLSLHQSHRLKAGHLLVFSCPLHRHRLEVDMLGAALREIKPISCEQAALKAAMRFVENLADTMNRAVVLGSADA